MIRFLPYVALLILFQGMSTKPRKFTSEIVEKRAAPGFSETILFPAPSLNMLARTFFIENVVVENKKLQILGILYCYDNAPYYLLWCTDDAKNYGRITSSEFVCNDRTAQLKALRNATKKGSGNFYLIKADIQTAQDQLILTSQEAFCWRKGGKAAQIKAIGTITKRPISNLAIQLGKHPIIDNAQFTFGKKGLIIESKNANTPPSAFDVYDNYPIASFVSTIAGSVDVINQHIDTIRFNTVLDGEQFILTGSRFSIQAGKLRFETKLEKFSRQLNIRIDLSNQFLIEGTSVTNPAPANCANPPPGENFGTCMQNNGRIEVLRLFLDGKLGNMTGETLLFENFQKGKIGLSTTTSKEFIFQPESTRLIGNDLYLTGSVK
jgi:hypothetical protein